MTRKVVEFLPIGMSRVEMTQGHRGLAHIPGKMRMPFMRVLPGDEVTAEMSSNDLT